MTDINKYKSVCLQHGTYQKLKDLQTEVREKHGFNLSKSALAMIAIDKEHDEMVLEKTKKSKYPDIVNRILFKWMGSKPRSSSEH